MSYKEIFYKYKTGAEYLRQAIDTGNVRVFKEGECYIYILFRRTKYSYLNIYNINYLYNDVIDLEMNCEKISESDFEKKCIEIFDFDIEKYYEKASNFSKFTY